VKVLNDPAPWWGMLQGPPLSIIDLIDNGTISVEGAAALWWAIERGASVMVAAAPQRAGKTTLATALLAFLPDDAAVFLTAGPRDARIVPSSNGPVYLLVNELSNHTPVYLAGPSARRAFTLLRDGTRMIGTLHADSAAEAVDVMHHESGIPATDIPGVNLVAVLRARRTASGVERRVVEIGLLTPNGDDVAVATVTLWEASTSRLQLSAHPQGATALARWAGVSHEQVEAEIAARRRALGDLAARGTRESEQVTEAVKRFRAAVRTGDAPA